jgi:hypothetical protein
MVAPLAELRTGSLLDALIAGVSINRVKSALDMRLMKAKRVNIVRIGQSFKLLVR